MQLRELVYNNLKMLGQEKLYDEKVYRTYRRKSRKLKGDNIHYKALAIADMIILNSSESLE